MEIVGSRDGAKQAKGRLVFTQDILKINLCLTHADVFTALQSGVD